ncbi:MAG TPA: Ku protein [Vicinamibacterales bacterium]|nr:Ku protein [Vicinamibacterales bacterium]
MARALWKGSLSFGLVNIPVELHVAVRDHRPHFRMLHAEDKSPVKFERVCAKEGTPVAWEDLVKGYEYSKGQFVVLTKDDFKAAAVEKTKRVDILDFVKAEEIDDRFFETPYYLVPAQGGDHAYALLREAIRKTERIGIAKFILREKLHLAAVEAIDDALVLSVMRFADELTDINALPLPRKAAFSKNELTMATTLVEQLAAEWEPEKYTDDYRDNLMRIIQSKAKGKKLVLESEEPERSAKVVDLMERLRQSLEAGKRTKGAAGRSVKKPSGGARSARGSKKKARTAA